jgi:signal transduction histidine kinase
MKSFASIWATLSHTGTRGLADPDLRKKIVLTNQLALVGALAILSYISTAPTKRVYSGVVLLACLVSTSAVWLNRGGHHALARLAVVLAPQISTASGYYLVYQVNAQTEFYVKFTIMATVILPLVTISIREKWLMATGLAVVIGNFLFGHSLAQAWLVPIYHPTELLPPGMAYVVPLVNFTMFFLGFTYLQRLNLAAENQIGNLLAQAQALNEELAQTNDTLHEKQRKLDMANRRLAQIVRNKTRALSERNRKLEDYAHFHAHQVRAPLARILGLVIVLQKTDEQDLAEILFCIEKVNEAARELDQIMQEFNANLGNG